MYSITTRHGLKMVIREISSGGRFALVNPCSLGEVMSKVMYENERHIRVDMCDMHDMHAPRLGSRSRNRLFRLENKDHGANQRMR